MTSHLFFIIINKRVEIKFLRSFKTRHNEVKGGARGHAFYLLTE